jgi:hypothetical protein
MLFGALRCLSTLLSESFAILKSIQLFSLLQSTGAERTTGALVASVPATTARTDARSNSDKSRRADGPSRYSGCRVANGPLSMI